MWPYENIYSIVYIYRIWSSKSMVNYLVLQCPAVGQAAGKVCSSARCAGVRGTQLTRS